MEEKKEVQKQSLYNCSIKEYCDLLENDRYVGGGSSAPIMSAIAMSLLIKILNVVKKKFNDFPYNKDIETHLKNFKDKYLWLAEKDVEVYEYSINCHKRLKLTNISDTYIQTNLFEKIKILSASPSILTLSYNNSPELDFCMGYVSGCCPDNLTSDFIIAKKFIDASTSSAESTIKVNLDEKPYYTFGFKYIEEIDEYKTSIEKMIADLESREYIVKDNIDSLLDTLKYVYDKDNGVDKVNIVQDGTNVVINISPELFNIVSEILVSKFLSTYNK